MNKRILALFVGLCCWLPMSAQSGTELLAGLREHLLGGGTWRIQLHILAEMDRKIEFFNDQATLTLQEDCYRLEGEYFAFYADSAAVWLVDPTAGEITVSERVFSYDNFLENPLAVLQEEALDQFVVSEPVTRIDQGKQLRVFQMTSRTQEGQEPWVVEVAIGPEPNRLRSLTCTRERESYRIQVLDLASHAALDPAYFTPEASLLESMEVVDLR